MFRPTCTGHQIFLRSKVVTTVDHRGGTNFLLPAASCGNDDVGGGSAPQPAGESRCEHAAPRHGRSREQQVCLAMPAASDCWHRGFSSCLWSSEEAHCTLFPLLLSSPSLITQARPPCFPGLIFPHIHAMGSDISPPHGHRCCFRHPMLSPFPKRKQARLCAARQTSSEIHQACSDAGLRPCRAFVYISCCGCGWSVGKNVRGPRLYQGAALAPLHNHQNPHSKHRPPTSPQTRPLATHFLECS